jgi:hypothetical protein
VRPRTLAALSRPLGISIDYLVRGTPSPSTMLVHSAFPYRTDDQFVKTIGPVLAEGVERSEALLAVTAAGNIELLREHLGRERRKVQFVEANSFYTTPAAALDAYRAFVEANLDRGVHWVRVVGEPVWAGRSEAAIRLWTKYESILNLCLSSYPLTIVCPYDERSCAAEIVRDAHLTHPHTISERGTSDSPDYADPGRFTLEP